MRCRFSTPFLGLLALGCLAFDVGFAGAADWLNWRGPLQSGASAETNLPDSWDPRTVGKNNLVWKAPYGCRSTPLIMNGKVYLINAYGETPNVPTPTQKALIGERVMCLDAKDGKLIWEQVFNVFHSDIVTNRLGWAPLAADPVAKRIFAHSTGGFLFCFDAEKGDIVWQRQLTEEFGRVTGYGGRIGGGPTFDPVTGNVIVGLINSSWGDQGIGGCRIAGFNGKTGELAWWGVCPGAIRGTFYSNPIVATINGERLVIIGGGDGAAHAFHARTGKRVWSHVCATGVLNPSPVVDGNLIYICHGEENPEGADAGLGRIVCLDGSKVKDGKPEVVWEFRKGVRFGLASPAIADGKLYAPDDGAKLYCFDAKKGKMLWKFNYGTVARGAPLVADGKVFITETTARFRTIKLKSDGSEPDDDDSHTVAFKNQPGAEGFVEVNSTPSVADGCIYVGTRDELYCIGKPNRKSFAGKPIVEAEENKGDAAKGYLHITPAEVVLHPGGKADFKLQWYSSTGVPCARPMPDGESIPLEFVFPEPPIPKGAKSGPPALKAEFTKKDATGCSIMVDAKTPSQAGYVDVKWGTATARARIRVAPVLPIKQDFEKISVGGVPSGWVNTQGKYRVVQVEENGVKNNLLFKVNSDPRPPLARANAYITVPNTTDYTIEADVKAVEVRGKLPDMGVIANRYTLYLDGKTNASGSREIKMLTWEALTPRPEGRVQSSKSFDWKSGTWYRLKLTVEIGEKTGTVRGKVWEKGKSEPADWTLELTDPRPNRQGAAALYGYITNASTSEPGSEIYYDNIEIKPNTKK